MTHQAVSATLQTEGNPGKYSMATLDIDVTLKLKENPKSIKDLDFFYNASIAPPAGVTVGKEGHIDIDKAASWPVDINFQLRTTEVEFDSMKYAISFELVSTSTSKPLLIRRSTSPAPPEVFTDPIVDPSKLAVSTRAKKMDEVTYKYTLTLGAKDSRNFVTDVPHDPKIRNGGGSKADPGIAPEHVAIGLLAAAALALLLWKAMSS